MGVFQDFVRSLFFMREQQKHGKFRFAARHKIIGQLAAAVIDQAGPEAF